MDKNLTLVRLLRLENVGTSVRMLDMDKDPGIIN